MYLVLIRRTDPLKSSSPSSQLDQVFDSLNVRGNNSAVLISETSLVWMDRSEVHMQHCRSTVGFIYRIHLGLSASRIRFLIG